MMRRSRRSALGHLALTLAAPALARAADAAQASPTRGAATSAAPVLYASPTTRAHLPRVKGRQEAMLDPWRRCLAAMADAGSPRHREIRSAGQLSELAAQAERSPAARAPVLIVPSTVALADDERAALLRLRRAGGHLMVSWACGARDAEGRWRGHDFLRSLTGIDVTGEVAADDAERFVVPYGDTPLNATVPAGRRIWLGDLGERPLRLQGGYPAAAYTNWSRTVLVPGAETAGVVFDEGPTMASPGEGRRVVFGFAETAWSFQPADVDALATQALQWLLRRPRVHLGSWPHAQHAAQLLEMDTEEGFANAIHFAELLDQMKATGTFYCLTSEARQHEDLLRRLGRHHELGFHGEVHYGFAAVSREIQQRRLKRSIDELALVLGRDATGWPKGVGRGFRAPTESYDGTTEALLQSMGWRHHTADPDRTPDRLPLFASAGATDERPIASADALVVLPRGQLDDLNYLSLKLTPRQIGAALVAEYDFNLALGGLGIISVHSQNFADPDQVLQHPLHSTAVTQAMEALARHVGGGHDRAWIASGEQIADWWRQRSRVRLEVGASDRADTLSLTLDVRPGPPIEGLTLLAASPGPRARLVVEASVASRAPVARRLDDFTTALVLPALGAGRHRLSVRWR